jgi:hypothetical protein
MLSLEQIEAACRRSETIVLSHPMSQHTELPLQAVFYPLGFPVHIATNSEGILNAAAFSWEGIPKLFDTPPIELRICVTAGHSSHCPSAPVFRMQRNLLSHIADSDNFSICDLAQGFCSIWLTQAAVEHEDYLRFYFLEASVLCQIASRYTTPIHSACVELDGRGFLLCGDSGAGKSTLAYACAQSGWTYVTDDASYILHGREDRTIVGNCNQIRFRPAAAEFFPELEGREVTQRGEMGKPSIQLSQPQFRNIRRSNTSAIDYVVFLNRREVTHPEVAPFSREAARYFMQQPLIRVPEMVAVQDAAIDRLLEAEVLEIRYRDFDRAIEQLSCLAREGQSCS